MKCFSIRENQDIFPLWSETPRTTEEPEVGNSVCFPSSVSPAASLLCYPQRPGPLLEALPKTGSPSCWQRITFSPSKFFPKKNQPLFKHYLQNSQDWIVNTCSKSMEESVLLFCIHLLGLLFKSLLFTFICLCLIITLSSKSNNSSWEKTAQILQNTEGFSVKKD